MRVYIAGPMSGCENYNFPAFDKAAADLRSMGYEPISPAEGDRALGFDGSTPPPPQAWVEERMMENLRAIYADADAVMLLDGWQSSRGSLVEVAWARYLGRRCYGPGMRAINLSPVLAPEAPKETCLEEAQRLVYGDRGDAYGHPLDDYSRAVGAFNALYGTSLTPEQGVQFMCCVKMSREAKGHKRDNMVDLAGYAECVQLIVDERMRRDG